jgi:predicted CXXCH cytochrome family protein
MKVPSFLLAAVWAAAASAAGGSVAGSKHDLSVNGPGPIKATKEKSSCVFCHVSHRGGAGTHLSGRPEIGNTHVAYESSTMRARPSGPTRGSRICLSCHDGTIAVGKTRERDIAVKGGTADGKIPSTRRSNLGTDLRATHPISVPVSNSPKLRKPGDPHVKLDAGGDVQCTSCHDPHSEFGGSSEGRFLVSPTTRSQLCTACHDRLKGAHGSSMLPSAVGAGGQPVTGAPSASAPSAPPSGTQPAAAPSVADVGCGACHRSHGADPAGRLLARGATEADDAPCLRCHGNGNDPTVANVAADLAKPWTHAIEGNRVHDAAEGPDSARHRLPETSASQRRHASCVDCHSAHDSTNTAARAPFAPGALQGTWGIDEFGKRVAEVRYEYEVCFKCHADSANKPDARWRRAGANVRRFEDRNLRRAFGAAAASSHPVVAAVRGGDVPSLLKPYSPGDRIYCTDCHASDSRAKGGLGARGPHGSMWAPLLEREYSTTYPTIYADSKYDLCFKCHDLNVLLSSRSAFPAHRKHVVDDSAPCAVCHASHGVGGPAASASRNAHLIDFDTRVVGAARSGPTEYERSGVRSGSCNLTCHGVVHDRRGYAPATLLRATRSR